MRRPLRWWKPDNWFRADPQILGCAATVGMVGIMACLSIFWSVPTALLAGIAPAGGIALVNSMGKLSGFVAPYMLGYIKDATKSLSLGLYSLSALLVLGGILVLAFAPRRSK